MNILIVVGKDKISRKLVNHLPQDNRLFVVIDDSNTTGRIIKLLRKKRISLNNLIHMFLSEMFRRDYKISSCQKIKTNQDLLEVISNHKIDLVILFRASLIINQQLMNSKSRILNVHCAKLPDYSGLGAISRALKNQDYDQVATLHKVATRIDSGEIIATSPYKLNRSWSYFNNENTAYDAGIKLILDKELSKFEK
jgi:folate-dependent phosphoribosylglycinamide formyltransferase PurN